MDLPHPIAQAVVEAVVDVEMAVVVVEVAMTLDNLTDIAAVAVAADNPDCTHRSHFVLDRYSFQPCLDHAVRLNILNGFYNYRRLAADLASNTFGILSLADRPSEYLLRFQMA